MPSKTVPPRNTASVETWSTASASGISCPFIQQYSGCTRSIITRYRDPLSLHLQLQSQTPGCEPVVSDSDHGARPRQSRADGGCPMATPKAATDPTADHKSVEEHSKIFRDLLLG